MFRLSPSRNTSSRNHQVYLPGDHIGRTHHSVVTAALEAEAGGEPVNGIIRSSPLTSILDLVDSIPVDYMHAVLEGVTRLLLISWFLTCNHGEPFYLGSKLAEIDRIFWNSVHHLSLVDHHVRYPST